MGKQQQGSSLVEVMVALFVLAIGILGILAMQTRAMQFNQSAYSYAQAVFLANDIAERIRGNAAVAGSYIAGIPETDPGACLGAQAVVNCDLYHWGQNLSQRLPAGEGTIDAVTNEGRQYLRVSVSFDDSRSASQASPQGDPTASTQSYTLYVSIDGLGFGA